MSDSLRMSAVPFPPSDALPSNLRSQDLPRHFKSMDHSAITSGNGHTRGKRLNPASGRKNAIIVPLAETTQNGRLRGESSGKPAPEATVFSRRTAPGVRNLLQHVKSVRGREIRLKRAKDQQKAGAVPVLTSVVRVEILENIYGRVKLFYHLVQRGQRILAGRGSGLG